mmetsp:Transcript_65395/g.191370  ORF Transcript_65395/g.191370 Transcript_65395/m.191370 type:complete len:764 (-) Transcript_65395:117-2408(-)
MKPSIGLPARAAEDPEHGLALDSHLSSLSLHSTKATGSPTPKLTERAQTEVGSVPCLRVPWGLGAILLLGQVIAALFTVCVPDSKRYLHYKESLRPDASEEWLEAKYGEWMKQFAALVSFVLCVVFQWLRMRRHIQADKSLIAFHAAAYMLSMWAVNVAQVLRLTILWYLPCKHCTLMGMVDIHDVVIFLMDMQIVLTDYYFYYVVGCQLAFVEVAWGARLGSWWMVFTRNVGLVLQTMAFTVGGVNLHGLADSNHFWAVVAATQAWTPLFAGWITFRALSEVRRPALEPAPCIRGLAQAEQVWSRDYLTFVRRGMVAPLAVNCLGYLAKVVAFNFQDVFDKYSMVLDAVATLLSLIAEAICLLLILGIFKEQRPLLQTPQRDGGSISMTRASSHTAGFKATALALAGRGMTVSALLDFYQKLGPMGSVMPHFSTRVSTTNDVVRQAIIPLSRVGDGGVAYADLARAENQGFPSCMVTHTWSCLFSVLVASVVADAIQQDEYAGVLRALEAGQVLELRDQVEACGTATRTYWICAFCVNQHAGICGGVGSPPTEDSAYRLWDAGRRDTVTGELHPLCACQQRKIFNDCPDECEMNKFDTMMFELSNRVHGFQQLVVVDPDFTLFSRAWCVAELVQASRCKITQVVKVRSREGIDLYSDDMAIYRKLASLTVTACQASREEDRIAILASIVDVQAFDAQLQDLIFGDRGLMHRQFAGVGLLDAAVRTARRLACLRQDTQVSWLRQDAPCNCSSPNWSPHVRSQV